MKYQSFNHVARAFTLLSSSSSPSHLSVACLASKPSGSKSSASVEVWQTKLSDRSKKKRKNARQISLLPQSAILNTFTHALFINTVAQYFPEFRCRTEVAIVPYAILLWIALCRFLRYVAVFVKMSSVTSGLYQLEKLPFTSVRTYLFSCISFDFLIWFHTLPFCCQTCNHWQSNGECW